MKKGAIKTPTGNSYGFIIRELSVEIKPNHLILDTKRIGMIF
jgi:hypothetical protein